jgi:hypothetical protein
LFALAVNKQLDIQSLLTDIGRVLAHRQGWYEARRGVQKTFILALLLLGAVGLAGVWYLARGPMKELRISLAGLVVILTFVVTRAASFHHMDRLIGTRVLGMRMNGVLELSGIFLVAFGAALTIRRKRQESDRTARTQAGSGSSRGT